MKNERYFQSFQKKIDVVEEYFAIICEVVVPFYNFYICNEKSTTFLNKTCTEMYKFKSKT